MAYFNSKKMKEEGSDDKKNEKQRKRGFTLVEILISVAIFIIVVAAVVDVYLAGQKLYQKGEDQAELLQNGRVLLEKMSREIRQSEEIVTQMPSISTDPNNPPVHEIEFQDGHTPSPYSYLNSDYYYIRYSVATGTTEVHRQYLVYCFDDCSNCNGYFRWNDVKTDGDGNTTSTHPCILEDKVVAEYVTNLSIWGGGTVNIDLTLSKNNSKTELRTAVHGRNL